MIIRQERFNLEDENKLFDLLLEKEIISKDLYIKLKNAKGMRNIISHRYGEIDNKIVFYSIKKELLLDINLFLEEIEKQFTNGFLSNE